MEALNLCNLLLFLLNHENYYTFTFRTHCRPKHAHRLNKNATILSARIAQKNPTIACGPTVSTSSPLIGIQISAARLAMKYIDP